MLKISAVIIAFNEQDRLARCIKALSWVEEVLVVDCGSTDSTVEIARSLGARVIHHPWEGYGPQKRFAVSQAKHDWVLSVDADEVVSDALRAELIALDPPSECAAVAFPRQGDFLGHWIKNYHKADECIVRLFDRRRAEFSDAAVHETVTVLEGSVARAKGVLLHYGFRSLSDHARRFDAYSSLEARILFASGQRFAIWKLVYYPARRLIWMLLVRSSVSDGIPGIAVTLYWVWFEILKLLKLYELEHSAGSAPL